MQQLIYFFRKFKYFLFFLLLEFVALSLIFNNLNYQRSKFVNSANTITGGFYSQFSNISEYLNLKSENKRLAEENTKLRNLLSQKKILDSLNQIDHTVIDTIKFNQKYKYTSAKIINNNYTNQFNFLTLNKGEKEGLAKEMAVFNSKGIVGILENTSNDYSRVQSVLNRDSRINARLKNTNYFGTLTWDGKDYKTVQLYDIPRQAPLKVGDTIVTDGKSAIFPEGILIGKINKINKGNTADNKIDVLLFNDMSNLGYVYVVKNFSKTEIKKLEQNE
ncbi:MAG: rod shape-determining protein MreC [Flavobacteriaceae bacterium]|nr:rod shape-determining protein MreC [Flavobacteriaceae bacterium]